MENNDTLKSKSSLGYEFVLPLGTYFTRLVWLNLNQQNSDTSLDKVTYYSLAGSMSIGDPISTNRAKVVFWKDIILTILLNILGRKLFPESPSSVQVNYLHLLNSFNIFQQKMFLLWCRCCRQASAEGVMESTSQTWISRSADLLTMLLREKNVFERR